MLLCLFYYDDWDGTQRKEDKSTLSMPPSRSRQKLPLLLPVPSLVEAGLATTYYTVLVDPPPLYKRLDLGERRHHQTHSPCASDSLTSLTSIAAWTYATRPNGRTLSQTNFSHRSYGRCSPHYRCISSTSTVAEHPPASCIGTRVRMGFLYRKPIAGVFDHSHLGYVMMLNAYVHPQIHGKLTLAVDLCRVRDAIISKESSLNGSGTGDRRSPSVP